MKHHKTNAELFADARRALLGHLSIAVWSLLLFVSLSILLTEFSYTFNFSNKYLGLTLNLAVRYLSTVFVSLFGIGLSSIFLRLLYGKQVLVRNLLTGFFENSDTCIRVRAFITAGQFVCLLPLQLYMYVGYGHSAFNTAPDYQDRLLRFFLGEEPGNKETPG